MKCMIRYYKNANFDTWGTYLNVRITIEKYTKVVDKCVPKKSILTTKYTK